MLLWTMVGSPKGWDPLRYMEVAATWWPQLTTTATTKLRAYCDCNNTALFHFIFTEALINIYILENIIDKMFKLRYIRSIQLHLLSQDLIHIHTNT